MRWKEDDCSFLHETPRGGEAYGAEEGGEIGIGPNPIEARLDVRPDQPRGALVEGAAHPVDDLVAVVETVEDDGT